MLSLRSQLILGFMPAMNGTVQALIRLGSRLANSEADLNAIKRAFVLLGLAATAAAARAIIAWAAAAGPLLIAAAAVAVLILAADELWQTWHGGDTMLRRFINEVAPGVVAGLSATDRAILGVTGAFATLGAMVGGLGMILQGFGQSIYLYLVTPLRIAHGIAVALFNLVSGAGLGASVRAGIGAASRVPGTGGQTAGQAHGVAGGLMLEGARVLSSPADAATRGGFMSSLLPQFIRDRMAGSRARNAEMAQAKIDARQTVSISFGAGAGLDADAVDRTVRRVVREENERQARTLSAALVPAGGGA